MPETLSTPEPATYKPTRPDQLFGQARAEAEVLLRKAQRVAPHGTPLTYLVHGFTGAGKTTVARMLCRYLIGDKAGAHFNLDHINGADLNAGKGRAIWERFERGRSLYGGYQGVLIDEVDLATTAALEGMLIPLENLPPFSFIIATTNASPDLLPQRFHSRFQQIEFRKPAQHHVMELLASFGIEGPIAFRIAAGADGSFRTALKDAQSYLDSLL